MKIKIGDKNIGDNSPVFIVAELSANHNKDFNIAVRTIRAIKKSGADAVKIQTYTPDTITIDCDNEYFRIKQGTIWDGQTLYNLYKEAYTPWEWQPKLKKIAENEGLIFFSTPFDNSAVDFLEEMNIPIYKVASFEITDLPLIKYIASKGKPIILSTGIAKLSEIRDAIKACKKMNNENIIILKCTSSYPAPVDEINLKTLPDMSKKLKKIVGLSDHTLGYSTAIAAVSFGAKVIEKHFILDKNIDGPDAAFSMEPGEFKDMVKAIRDVENAIGKVTYNLSDGSKRNREFSRSLFAVEDIIKDECFTSKNIRSIRPGFGLAPKYIEKIINKKAKVDIKRGTPLSWDLIK